MLLGTIQLKSSATPGAAPSSLTQGEIAINEADGLLFFRGPDGSVKAMSLNPPPDVPAASVMLFIQAAAPTGWTKVTTNNDIALRIVSGTGGVFHAGPAFSVTFAGRTTEPAEADNESLTDPDVSLIMIGTHSHAIDMTVAYIDAIIASKD